MLAPVEINSNGPITPKTIATIESRRGLNLAFSGLMKSGTAMGKFETVCGQAASRATLFRALKFGGGGEVRDSLWSVEA